MIRKLPMLIACFAVAAFAQAAQQSSQNAAVAAKPSAQSAPQNGQSAPAQPASAATATAPEASSAQNTQEAPGTSALPQSDIENSAVSETSNLQNEVQGAIAHEPTLEGAQIAVTAKDGEIELTGTVPNGKARETARRIASSYAVNQRVVDHMKVAAAPQPAQENQKSSKPSSSSTPPPHS